MEMTKNNNKGIIKFVIVVVILLFIVSIGNKDKKQGFGCSSGNGGGCTITSWTPSHSTICSGTSFTQTSNCGTTRTQTGVKMDGCFEICTESEAMHPSGDISHDGYVALLKQQCGDLTINYIWVPQSEIAVGIPPEYVKDGNLLCNGYCVVMG